MRAHTCPRCGVPVTGSSAYCPRHRRAGSWSGRDRAAHMRFRRAVVARDGACQRCGATTGLHAHHLVPGNHDPHVGVTLCGPCHRAMDAHAR